MTTVKANCEGVKVTGISKWLFAAKRPGEGSQMWNVWDVMSQPVFRVEDAARRFRRAPSERETAARRVPQTLHIWLPSLRAFSAKD
jgi:hypothetical protein